jgi:choline kinase
VKALVLGAGHTVLASSGVAVPKCLLEGIAGWRVLDWLLNALREGGRVDDVVFVGGDGIDTIRAQYDDLRFVHNPRWADEHVVGSLFAAAGELDEAFYFTYADIVYRPDTVERLRRAAGDVVIVVDRAWRTRYRDRNRAQLEDAEKVVAAGGQVRWIGKDIPLDAEITGEFIGLARFSERGAAWLRRTYGALIETYRNRPYRGRRDLHAANLSDLLQELVEQGLTVDVVTIDGEYAELDAPSDLAQFVFGTKAETLERLRPLLRQAHVTDGHLVRVGDWTHKRDEVVTELADRFGGAALAVRSSALGEDTQTSSAAGRYHSVIGVEGDDVDAIAAAVDAVVASYDRDGQRDENQVLVQPCLTEVVMSGVMMTRDVDNGAEYLVVNYDDTTGRTDSVTAGDAAHTSTVRIHRGSEERPDDPRLAALVNTAEELEAITGSDALDVEFAITRDESLHVLQVRPITRRTEWTPVDPRAHAEELEELRSFLRVRLGPRPGVAGSSTVLGQMPDWNPAEMIGPFPSVLSRTLYELLITDATWREARVDLGYFDAFPHALMVELAGRPYVDVRLSANSLLPAGLDPRIRTAVVDAGLQRLRAHPELHDKIEFEVFPTTYHVRVEDTCRDLVDAGMPASYVDTLVDALRAHTRRLLDGGAEGVDAILARTAGLEGHTRRAWADETDPLDRARTLLAHTVRQGTRPFSALARLSFVGTAMLRSLQADGVVGADDLELFGRSVRTISTEMMEDLEAVQTGTVSLDDFLATFGHLRPGTYDLLSPRYDQDPQLYFGESTRGGTAPAATVDDVPSGWHDDFTRRVDARLRTADLGVDGAGFLAFLRAAVAGRELAKFRFSRALSAALELIAEFGARHELSRDELVHLDAKALLAITDAARPPELGDDLRRRALAARMRRERQALLHLPGVITHESDLTIVRSTVSRPNFVTSGRVRGELLHLRDTAAGDAGALRGRVVLLEGADPGYDWIFAHGIAGLITRYGGANSHMTIRCAEFGLPAAIGCGDTLYDTLRRARRVDLDCAGETIRVVA